MHAPTGRLRIITIIAVLLVWLTAGQSSAAEGARLRPRLFLSLFPPRVEASLLVLGGGWIAWPQADVPRTARQTPPFTLHLYNLATRDAHPAPSHAPSRAVGERTLGVGFVDSLGTDAE